MQAIHKGQKYFHTIQWRNNGTILSVVRHEWSSLMGWVTCVTYIFLCSYCLNKKTQLRANDNFSPTHLSHSCPTSPSSLTHRKQDGRIPRISDEVEPSLEHSNPPFPLSKVTQDFNLLLFFFPFWYPTHAVNEIAKQINVQSSEVVQRNSSFPRVYCTVTSENVWKNIRILYCICQMEDDADWNE